VREIRMLRVMWRELETGSRTSPAGHEGGKPGYRQGMFYRLPRQLSTLPPGLAAATVASSGSGVAEIREFPGLTRHGPSGLVLVPTGHVIRPNWYAVGLHRGVLKANYGILGYAEVGVTLPDLFDKENFSLSLWDNKTVLFV